MSNSVPSPPHEGSVTSSTAANPPLKTPLMVMVFQPTLSVNEDTEADKLIAFYPSQTPLHQQCHHIGIVEAIATFTSDFSPDQPCEMIHCQHCIYTVFQCEPGIWTVLWTEKMASGVDPHDSMLQDSLKQVYSMFRLFHGPISQLSSSQGIGPTRCLVKKFVDSFVPCLRLDPKIATTDMDGIVYLPLDRAGYLSLQTFISLLNSICTVALLQYERKAVWVGCSLDQVLLLHCLDQDHTATFLNDITKVVSPGEAASIANTSQYFGECRSGPYLYLSEGKDSTEKLVLFRHGKLSIFMKRSAPNDSDSEFFTRLVSTLKPDLPNLLICLRDHCCRPPKACERLKFLYLNGQNKALKSNLVSTMPAECLNLIREIRQDFDRSDSPLEVCVRCKSFGWVIGKRCPETDRQYFIALEFKAGHLDRIQPEIDLVEEALFSSIFKF